MSSEAVAKIAKPQLRGLFQKQLKNNLIVTFVLVIGSGLSWHFLYNRPFKNRIAEFYKDYDIEKEFHDMRKKGLLDSCSATDGTESE